MKVQEVISEGIISSKILSKLFGKSASALAKGAENIGKKQIKKFNLLEI